MILLTYRHNGEMEDREMAWYYGTYSCGHDGRTNIVGPTKNRERKAEWHFSGLCPECYEKKQKEERKAANKEAAEKSAEMELPELSGTEKQVAWANTLRLKAINNLYLELEKLDKIFQENGIISITKENISIKEMSEAIDYFVNTYKNAKFWIETRNESRSIHEIVTEYRNHLATKIPDEIEEELREEKEKLTVIPEENKKSGIVEIKYSTSSLILSAEYVKDEDFQAIMKRLNFKWEGQWQRKITEFTGLITDRAAELGNTLLLAGFTVSFPTEEIKEKAISGKFAQENFRWIVRDSEKSLGIRWSERNDILYRSAKKLPGASWKNGKMIVSVKYYHEIEDFADTLGFSFSKNAKAVIASYKKKESRYERKEVNAPLDLIKKSDKERIEEKRLKQNGTILQDLLDEL